MLASSTCRKFPKDDYIVVKVHQEYGEVILFWPYLWSGVFLYDYKIFNLKQSKDCDQNLYPVFFIWHSCHRTTTLCVPYINTDNFQLHTNNLNEWNLYQFTNNSFDEYYERNIRENYNIFLRLQLWLRSRNFG